MEIFLIVLGSLVVLALDYLLAVWFEQVAMDKGYFDKSYKWLCFFFGICGYLLVIALPDRGNKISGKTAAKVREDEIPEL